MASPTVRRDEQAEKSFGAHHDSDQGHKEKAESGEKCQQQE